jgi:opacity protein-like surface antigen
MKKTFTVIGVTLALAVGAAAQDTPRAEVFLGYTYVRFRPSHDVLPDANLNGGSGQFAYNFTKSFSGVIDLGGVHATHSSEIVSRSRDTTAATFMAGPRYSWRSSRIRPYAQLLLGGVYVTTSRRITVIPVATTTAGNVIIADPNQAIDTRLSFGRGAFAMTAGGGLDFIVNKHFSVRPIQVEYFLTRFPDPIVFPHDRETQNNIRYSAGVNFTFGAR